MEHNDLLNNKIDDCRKGRPEAFAWLLEQYGGRLWGYFRRSSGSDNEAEDLLQELFLRLIEKIKDYRHEGRFESWLFRVAANLARDRARRRQREAHGLSEYGLNHRHGRADAVSDQRGPAESAVQAEQRDRLALALASLNELDREVIVLRHYGHLSFKEIARHFNMPIGTALAKVHRGLKQLRNIMGQNDEA